jgi:hypothetical protein
MEYLNSAIEKTNPHDADAVALVIEMLEAYCWQNRKDVITIPKGCEFVPQIRRKLAEYGITTKVAK